ncbi:DUF202 domain-containing protein [Nocardia carnea]|uniref:DUF202 domain-containing protein n=1 Tax=Nocardia carnea TaxID=37328 RepID=UPI00245584DA|nr:DUF202 domain-containing protein [Nocardia carnea]
MRTDQIGDGGLQVERTALSWRRTAVTLSGLAALVLHGGIKDGWGWASALSSLTVSAAASATAVLAHRRAGVLRSGRIDIGTPMEIALTSTVGGSVLAVSIAELAAH